MTRHDHVATTSAAVVSRLIRGNAIILGKTHMVEFALGGWGINHMMGSPRNPRDPFEHRTAGGSSSGPAVAVAGGFVPLALGSDTGGSIRVPAAFCGAVGLKPTFGRISNDGVAPLSATLDTVGPMTRSVEDAALFFGAMAGEPDIVDHIQNPVEGARLAIPTRSDLAELDVEPHVAEAFYAAVDTFEDLGATVDEVEMSDLITISISGTTTIIAVEGYKLYHRQVEDSAAPVDPVVRDRLLNAKSISEGCYREALAQRPDFQATYMARLESYVALLTPTTPMTALPSAGLNQGILPNSLTRLASYLGLCALALPCGFTRKGLPISLQIVGRPNDEQTILRLGLTYERATAWHRRHPPDFPKAHARPSHPAPYVW